MRVDVKKEQGYVVAAFKKARGRSGVFNAEKLRGTLVAKA